MVGPGVKKLQQLAVKPKIVKKDELHVVSVEKRYKLLIENLSYIYLKIFSFVNFLILQAKTVAELRNKAKSQSFAKRDVRVSKSQAKFISYFLDRYGEDYQVCFCLIKKRFNFSLIFHVLGCTVETMIKGGLLLMLSLLDFYYIRSATYILINCIFFVQAMVNDPMNYDQFTWKQFRAQVRSFKNTKSQFGAYLLDRAHLIEAGTTQQKTTQQDRTEQETTESDGDDQSDDSE